MMYMYLQKSTLGETVAPTVSNSQENHRLKTDSNSQTMTGNKYTWKILLFDSCLPVLSADNLCKDFRLKLFDTILMVFLTVFENINFEKISRQHNWSFHSMESYFNSSIVVYCHFCKQFGPRSGPTFCWS